MSAHLNFGDCSMIVVPSASTVGFTAPQKQITPAPEAPMAQSRLTEEQRLIVAMAQTIRDLGFRFKNAKRIRMLTRMEDHIEFSAREAEQITEMLEMLGIQAEPWL
jgi:hypothetical protein